MSLNRAPSMRQTFWTMHTADGHWYPVQPSIFCKPKDHGELNPHVARICDADGNVIWERASQ